MSLNWNQRGAQSATQRVGDYSVQKSTHSEQHSYYWIEYLHVTTAQAMKQSSFFALCVEGKHDLMYIVEGTTCTVIHGCELMHSLTFNTI